MAIWNSVVMGANKAMNKIPALMKQARSYYSNPAMLQARGLASRLANAPGVQRNALIGAGIGAAGGAGYDYATNDRRSTGSMIGAGIKGGLLGGLGGAGYTYGRAGVGMARSRGITAAGVMAGARGKMAGYGAAAKSGWGNMVARAQASRGFGGY